MTLRISIIPLFIFLVALVASVFLLSSFTVESVSIPANAGNSFFSQHWPEIALIISEIAAVFGKKYSGIIQSIIVVISEILKKK